MINGQLSSERSGKLVGMDESPLNPHFLTSLFPRDLVFNSYIYQTDIKMINFAIYSLALIRYLS